MKIKKVYNCYMLSSEAHITCDIVSFNVVDSEMFRSKARAQKFIAQQKSKGEQWVISEELADEQIYKECE